MKTKTSRMTVVALFALAVVSSALWAQGTGVWNYSTGMQKEVKGYLEDGSGTGSVVTRFWAVRNAADHNSGSLLTTSQLLPWAPNTYLVWSDWTAQGVYGGPPLKTDRTAFLYSMENDGQGQYLLLSVAYDDVLGGYNFDNVTNGNVVLRLKPNFTKPGVSENRSEPFDLVAPSVSNQEMPLTVPQLVLGGVKQTDTDALVSVTWAPVAVTKGFYDSAPERNLLTGVAVRYTFGYDAPRSHRTADWALAEDGFVDFGGAGTDPGDARVTVPLPPSGMSVFLALSLLFDGAMPASETCNFTETAFLGGAASFAPNMADPVFGSLVADNSSKGVLAVTWTMEQERGVSSYEVYGAPSPLGPFRSLSDRVFSHYPTSTPYNLKTRVGSVKYVRVDAAMASGRTVSSAVTALTR